MAKQYPPNTRKTATVNAEKRLKNKGGEWIYFFKNFHLPLQRIFTLRLVVPRPFPRGIVTLYSRLPSDDAL